MLKDYLYQTKAMGTTLDVQIIAEENPELGFEKIKKFFAEYENIFSRFKADSELYILNQTKKIKPSPVFFEAFQRALELNNQSEGWFNFLVSPVAIGYTKSFDSGEFSKDFHDYNTNINDIIEISENCIQLQENQFIDFGGFMKGYTVDKIKYSLNQYPGYWISAGGDMYIKGKYLDGNDFIIGLKNPLGDGDLGVFQLSNKALATSGKYKRNWSIDGKEYHHIMDPNTHISAQGEVVSASVIANNNALADALATVCCILDPQIAVSLLEKNNCEGIMYTKNKEFIITSNINKYFTKK